MWFTTQFKRGKCVDLIFLQNQYIQLQRFNASLMSIIWVKSKPMWFIMQLQQRFVRKPLIYSFHGIHLKCLNSFQKLTYISLENFSGFLDTYKVLSSKSEKLYAEKSNIRLGKNNLIINNGVKNKKIKSYLNSRESRIAIVKKNLLRPHLMTEQAKSQVGATMLLA